MTRGDIPNLRCRTVGSVGSSDSPTDLHEESELIARESPEFLRARSVFVPKVVLGPPGTGKTTELLRELEGELRRGVPPERIAFVTFTRAARGEAQRGVKKALGYSHDRLPWLRTIHSTAFRLLQISRKRILSGERWMEFAERYGYDLTRLLSAADSPDEAPCNPPRRTEADLCRYVWSWGRSHRVNSEIALARCPVEGLGAGFYRLFVQRLEHYMRLEHLLDFNDLLENVLRAGLRPDVDVAFIDEAQDLSPLQAAVCEAWFTPCVRSYVAGDDDQAIYDFQGATPAWLRDLASRQEPKILAHSHRVPKNAHQLAQRIIAQNRERVPKEYQPTDEAGLVQVLDLSEALDLIPEHETTFVLARNRMHLQKAASALIDRGVAYVVEGDGATSPLSGKRLKRAIEAADDLVDGQDVSARSVHALLSLVRPDERLVARDSRERIKALAKVGTQVRSGEFEKLGLTELTERIRSKGMLAVMSVLSTRVRRYVDAVLHEYGEIPHPSVVLTSIHGAKGREADLVIVLSDMTRATFDGYGRRRKPRDYETENRVFYVAVTRTKRTLVLVRPRGRRHYEFPAVKKREQLVS